MHIVSLVSKKFDEAKSTFIDKHKPDNLLKKQIQRIKFEWQNTDSSHNNEDDIPSFHFWENRISGILNISSELSFVKIYADCVWYEGIGAHNEMKFSLHAHAAFKNSGYTLNHLEKGDLDRKEKRTREKNQSRLKDRLIIDPYVKTLMIGNEETKVLLLEAHIKLDYNQSNRNEIEKLEERVATESDALTGLRLLIFSLMDSNIDLAEFLLYLPYLPREKNDVYSSISSFLAERVTLRLLEDVMFDECEREGEDDLLDDLKICEDGEDRPTSNDQIQMKKIKR